MSARGPLAVVAGPTASGKSALALALAEALERDGQPATIVNADSMQVYCELAILTARPGAGDLARAPHRLYGVLSAAEACSAGRWRALALAEIDSARAAGRLPLIVGGSGLYLEALTNGLAPVPPVPPETRRRADSLHAALGPEAFHAALAARDPGARGLASGDAQRVKRAWAVLEATGRPLCAWQADAGPAEASPCAVLRVLLRPERAALYRACDARFEAMMARGALDEARALAALGLDPGLPAMKALGVRPLLDHLAGALDRGAAVARAQRDTRRYAKRQTTWFLHRYPADIVVAGGPGAIADAVAACLAAVRRFPCGEDATRVDPVAARA